MNKTTFRRIAFPVLILLTSSIPAHANFMEDFYDSAGAGSNVTLPQAYSTQNVTGFSGGGLSWRVPNKNFAPVQITPPSLKAGCGGIDAYLGSYSFVNKQAFVDALRNFGQAALGYFFELALRSAAPEIAVTLDAINDLAQKVNQFNVNNCQEAKQLVDSIGAVMFDGKRQASAGYVTAMGTSVDFFDGLMSGNVTGGSEVYKRQYQEKYNVNNAAAVNPNDVGVKPPVNINLVYWLMKNSRISLSSDEEEALLSIIGPGYILKSTPDSDGTHVGVGDPLPPTISFADLVGDPENPTTFKIYSCSGVDAECTNPSLTSRNFDSFSRIAYKTIEQLRNAVLSRTAPSLSPLQQTVIRLSPIPIHRVAAMSTVTGSSAGAISDALKPAFSQYIGVIAASNFMESYLNEMERAAYSSGERLEKPLADQVRAIILPRIIELRRQVGEERSRVLQTVGNPGKVLEEAVRIEKEMMGQLTPQLAANIRFQHRH